MCDVCVHISGLPDGRGVMCRSRLVQKHSVGQILVQVSTFHVLGDHTEGITAHTHSQQTDDVRVLQARQDLHLFQEVVPTRTRRNQDEGISHRKERVKHADFRPHVKKRNGLNQHHRLELWPAVHLVDLFFWVNMFVLLRLSITT